MVNFKRACEIFIENKVSKDVVVKYICKNPHIPIDYLVILNKEYKFDKDDFKKMCEIEILRETFNVNNFFNIMELFDNSVFCKDHSVLINNLYKYKICILDYIIENNVKTILILYIHGILNRCQEEIKSIIPFIPFDINFENINLNEMDIDKLFEFINKKLHKQVDLINEIKTTLKNKKNGGKDYENYKYECFEHLRDDFY